MRSGDALDPCEQLRDRRSVTLDAAVFDQETGDAVVDQGAQSAHRGRHHWGTGCGRFERDQAERLGARRDEAHVGGSVVVDEPVVSDGTDELDARRNPELA